jgi:peptide chain release factor 1
LSGTVEPGLAGELLGHQQVLRQEALDAPGPPDELPVLFGELVDAEDRDDVLQVGVALQDALHLVGDPEVLVADVLRVEDPRRGGERVHRRVDALLGDRAGELGGGVEVRERGGGRRVGVVVGGHVDRLHRGDRTAARRRDPLLQLAHLVGQRGLVAHRGRHAAEQRGDLGARLGEPEDVVDEEQHVLVLLVAEVLRHRERGERDAACACRAARPSDRTPARCSR